VANIRVVTPLSSNTANRVMVNLNTLLSPTTLQEVSNIPLLQTTPTPLLLTNKHTVPLLNKATHHNKAINPSQTTAVLLHLTPQLRTANKVLRTHNPNLHMAKTATVSHPMALTLMDHPAAASMVLGKMARRDLEQHSWAAQRGALELIKWEEDYLEV